MAAASHATPCRGGVQETGREVQEKTGQSRRAEEHETWSEMMTASVREGIIFWTCHFLDVPCTLKHKVRMVAKVRMEEGLVLVRPPLPPLAAFRPW